MTVPVDKDKPRPKVDPARLRRSKPADPDDGHHNEPPSVSAGPVDKVVELTLNPSREKIREVTIVDRIQGRLLPQLDIIDLVWQYVIEVAVYRQDATEYERVFNRKQPMPPALINEFTYRTAQWQKSVQGVNLKSAIDLALAETENRMGSEGDYGGGDPWKE